MGNPTGTFATNYSNDNAIFRTRMQKLLAVLGVILACTFPFFAGPYLVHLINYIGILAVAAIGLNILTGYTGQISLGHSAFVAVGAYTSALLAINFGFPFWIALPCAALMAGAVGLIFGFPSMRIKGFYLLMSSLAAQFIIMYVLSHWTSMTGGTIGLANVPTPTLAGFVFSSEQSFYYIVLVVVILATLSCKNFTRSRIGRAFIAVRDNDKAAQVMGVNVNSYKLMAFFIGCAYAGAAGSLMAHWIGSVQADQFTLMDSIWYAGYIIVGGMGTTIGPIMGVIFIVAITEGLGRIMTIVGGADPQLMTAILPLRSVIFGLIITLFLIFEPRGLNHRWGLTKAYYRMWPFSY
jgi:branched-chain amino acid transport system permease protein